MTNHINNIKKRKCYISIQNSFRISGEKHFGADFIVFFAIESFVTIVDWVMHIDKRFILF